MRRSPMTESGALKLREEIQRLKSVDRPNVIKAIAEARAHGDLRENAEYHAAKEQQGFIEGRISEIERVLSTVEIIDPLAVNAKGRVVFGATVSISNVETAEEARYKIVGELEADVEQGLVSVTSPIARALIGKQEGDVAVVEAPSGPIEYEILDVEYL